MCQGRCFQPGPWPVCGARLTRYTRSHPAALGSWASPTSPARHCRPPSCVTTGWGSGWVPTVPLPAQRSCSVLGLGTAVPQFPHLQVDFPVAFSCPGAGAVVWMTPETCVSTIPPMGAHGPFGPRRGAGCWWLRGARAGGPWAGAVPGLCQTWGAPAPAGPQHTWAQGAELWGSYFGRGQEGLPLSSLPRSSLRTWLGWSQGRQCQTRAPRVDSAPHGQAGIAQWLIPWQSTRGGFTGSGAPRGSRALDEAGAGRGSGSGGCGGAVTCAAWTPRCQRPLDVTSGTAGPGPPRQPRPVPPAPNLATGRGAGAAGADDGGLLRQWLPG